MFSCSQSTVNRYSAMENLHTTNYNQRHVTMEWEVFQKRTDTLLRVLYTTSMGTVAYSSVWQHFTLSFLFNGSECSNPAPIRGGIASDQDGGNGNTDKKSVPAAISCVCNQLCSGDVTITSNLVTDNGPYGHYHGLYPSSITPII